MTRKVIQLCTGEHDNSRLYALCDDGKMFSNFSGEPTSNLWEEIPNVPQD